MQVTRLFLPVNVLSTNIGLIFVTLIAVENKADNTIDYQKTAGVWKSEIWLHVGDQIIINSVVIAARIMQVTRLFLSVNVLSTDIGLIIVALIAVEIKADNMVDYQKAAWAWNSEIWFHVRNQIIITALLFQLEPCKLHDCFCQSMCFRLM